MTQFCTYCELEFLPVYTPSEEEKRDPHLYANNVRRIMAESVTSLAVDALRRLWTEHSLHNFRSISLFFFFGRPFRTTTNAHSGLHNELGTRDSISWEK